MIFFNDGRNQSKRKLSTLIDTEVTRLHKSIKELTAFSVAVDADKINFKGLAVSHQMATRKGNVDRFGGKM